MSKQILSLLLCFVSYIAFPQDYIRLSKARKNTLKLSDKSIFIAEPVQDKRFLDFYFRHEIRLYDIRNRTYFSMTVKPRFSFRSKAKHFALPAGTYSILHYKRAKLGFRGIEKLFLTVTSEGGNPENIQDKVGKLTMANVNNIVISTSGEDKFLCKIIEEKSEELLIEIVSQ